MRHPNEASLSQQTSSRRRGITVAEVLLVIVILGCFAALFLPHLRRDIGPTVRRAQCANQLGNIALAVLNYEAEHQSLPPAYTVDANGRPLHSWRTLILP